MLIQSTRFLLIQKYLIFLDGNLCENIKETGIILPENAPAEYLRILSEILHI